MVKTIDPIIALTPYLMPMRCDAQVMLKLQVDYEKLARYIAQKGSEGYRFSFMDIFFSAYVRTVAQLPDLNRFIANKRIYARNELTISFVVLQDTKDGSVKENTIKCKFDPHDTIYDVAARTNAAIVAGRNEEVDNNTMKLAKLLLNPILANVIVGAARLLDRYGLMPRFIHEASPFHTSLFFTNMASIGMPAVNHHIYNFGTTSVFLSIGAVERQVVINEAGQPQRKRMLPLGITADERVCAGMVYSQMVATVTRYLADPSLLEKPPERVLFDENNYYGLPPAPRHKFLPRLRNITRLGRRRRKADRSDLAG